MCVPRVHSAIKSNSLPVLYLRYTVRLNEKRQSCVPKVHSACVLGVHSQNDFMKFYLTNLEGCATIMGKGVVVLQYVYGVSREGYVACEGLVEIVPDLTKKFLDLVITKKPFIFAHRNQ